MVPRRCDAATVNYDEPPASVTRYIPHRMPRLAVPAALALLLVSASPAGTRTPRRRPANFSCSPATRPSGCTRARRAFARAALRSTSPATAAASTRSTSPMTIAPTRMRSSSASRCTAATSSATTRPSSSRTRRSRTSRAGTGARIPNDHPLDTDDEPEAEPHVSAQSELNTIAQHGQYLSYEYKADLSVTGSEEWHTARRGVVDLRDAAAPTVADIFGASNGQYILRRGRTLFAQARDSLRATTRRDVARRRQRHRRLSLRRRELQHRRSERRARGEVLRARARRARRRIRAPAPRHSRVRARTGGRTRAKDFPPAATPRASAGRTPAIASSPVRRTTTAHSCRSSTAPATNGASPSFPRSRVASSGSTARAPTARRATRSPAPSTRPRSTPMKSARPRAQLSPRTHPARLRLVTDARTRERIAPRRGRELPIRTRTLP